MSTEMPTSKEEATKKRIIQALKALKGVERQLQEVLKEKEPK